MIHADENLLAKDWLVPQEDLAWKYLEKADKPKIKVLLLYIAYPLAIATYFKKAFQNRGDVDLRVAGPYTGAWIPWMGGMTLPEKYAVSIDYPLPFAPTIGEVNYDIVKTQLGDWVPDIIVNIDAGIHWKYKPSDGMVVTIGTDPHVLNEWYDTVRKYSDKFFNMQLCYSKEKDIYLPYAYSKYDHYADVAHVASTTDPRGYAELKDTDAVLIGMPYEQRTQWVNQLRAKGISVIFENGPVFDEARALYNRGRIGLNWSSLQDLNARAFELPAMKLAPVMNLVPDVGRFFEQGIHYKGFTNVAEAVEAVVWLKEHPKECDTMAQVAYENVKSETYDARIDLLLEECGFA